MSDNTTSTTQLDRLANAAKRFFTVESDTIVGASRGRILILLSSVCIALTALNVLFIAIPTTILNKLSDPSTNLFIVYCAVFILGMLGVLMLAKANMVREGSLLLLILMVAVVVAVSSVSGLHVRTLTFLMMMMNVIVMTAGLLGRHAGLIASLIITVIEAILLALFAPATEYDLLVDAAWLNFSIAALMAAILQPHEELAKKAERLIPANDAITRPSDADLLERFADETRQAASRIVSSLALAGESTQSAVMQLRDLQDRADELLAYSRVIQQADLHLEDYSPRLLALELHTALQARGYEADLRVDKHLPQSVYGLPDATQRALIRLAEAALHFSGSRRIEIDARIAKHQRWEVRLSARQATTQQNAAPIDPLTSRAIAALQSMGGTVEIDTDSPQVLISIHLRWKMTLRKKNR